MQQLNTLRIIWGAMLASIVMYIGIGFVVAAEQPGSPPETVELYRMVFTGLAVSVLVAIPVLRRVLMGGVFLAPSDRGMHGRDDGPAPEVLEAAMAKYMQGSLVGIALAESVCLYGLVLAFLAADGSEVLPFAAVSALAMAVQLPRESVLADIAQRMSTER